MQSQLQSHNGVAVLFPGRIELELSQQAYLKRADGFANYCMVKIVVTASKTYATQRQTLETDLV